MKYYVYELWDTIKNQPFYVGKGCGKRTYAHTSKRSLNTKSGNMLKKNVINKMLIEDNKPVVKYVFRTDNELESYAKETELILFYGRRDAGTGVLTNLTDGGVGSLNPNEETRKKISKAKLGKKESDETRKRKSEALMGHPVSDEAREKMSEKKRGKIPACIELRRSYIGEGNPQFGKRWSDEKKQKMSNSIKGRKRSYRDDGTWFFVYPEKKYV